MPSTGRASSRKAAPVGHSAGRRTNGDNGNGLERERVIGIQRARVLAAMAEAASEHGAANVTVAHVVERAGVSRRTFYELFDDRDDCLLAALEESARQAATRVVAAYQQRGRWRDRIRAGLVALLSFLEEEPSLGRLLIVETLAAGPRALRLRNELLSHLIAAVSEGEVEARRAAKPSQLVAEGTAGAVLSVLHGRLSRDEPAGLIELAGPLMSMIVLPYLGSAAARSELKRAAPRPERGLARRPANLLRQLDMRLTYRTMRVLLAVADMPGASNRQVGEGAGVRDQGQISKLLSRLEKLGLVVNEGLAPGCGAPNAWTLTEQGEEVRCALARRA